MISMSRFSGYRARLAATTIRDRRPSTIAMVAMHMARFFSMLALLLRSSQSALESADSALLQAELFRKAVKVEFFSRVQSPAVGGPV